MPKNADSGKCADRKQTPNILFMAEGVSISFFSRLSILKNTAKCSKWLLRFLHPPLLPILPLFKKTFCIDFSHIQSKTVFFFQKVAQIFAYSKYFLYLCTRFMRARE